ncbi:MAG: hypothetical protein WBD03_07220, partial [Thermoplasmata archaeon]
GLRLPHLVRYNLKIALALIAAMFMIGGLVMIGLNVGTALADHDFSLQTLSLSALFIIVFVLMVSLLKNWRRSKELSRYCPDCAMRY